MFHINHNKNTNFLCQLHSIINKSMPIKLFRLVSNICIYSIFFSLNIFSQSNHKLTGDIKESGIYYKDIVINWIPENKKHDLHTLGIREARFSFSDMKFTYTSQTTNHKQRQEKTKHRIVEVRQRALT